MKGYGLDLTDHRAIQLTPDLVAWADLILTMTAEQKTWIEEQFPEASAWTFTLSGYVGETGDIEDPTGGGDAVDRCAMQLSAYSRKVLRVLEGA